jgi:hypothetical protein
LTATSPRASSSAPKTSAWRAPLASAFLNCDFMLPGPSLPRHAHLTPALARSASTHGIAAAAPRRRARPHRRRVPAPAGQALLLQQVQHALDAHAPADARRRLAADQLDQPVVAPAAADRALRAERSVTHSKTVRL